MTSNKTSGLKPGQPAPASGQYIKRGSRGGKGDEVTVVRGEPMPPHDQKGGTYDLVDRTRNKSGRG